MESHVHQARTFCEEVVIIPKDGKLDADSVEADEADVWVCAMMYDADRGRSCLAILDGDRFEEGPVCKLWLKEHIPHGLHGCFTPDLFGPLAHAAAGDERVDS